MDHSFTLVNKKVTKPKKTNASCSYPRLRTWGMSQKKITDYKSIYSQKNQTLKSNISSDKRATGNVRLHSKISLQKQEVCPTFAARVQSASSKHVERMLSGHRSKER